MNTIFKGEYAIKSDAGRYHNMEKGVDYAASSEGEGDIGSIDSDSESKFVSLSAIEQRESEEIDEDGVGNSVVNEFQIKTRKISTPSQNMHFLPECIMKGKHVRLGMSRLGEPVNINDNANFESRVIN